MGGSGCRSWLSGEAVCERRRRGLGIQALRRTGNSSSTSGTVNEQIAPVRVGARHYPCVIVPTPPCLTVPTPPCLTMIMMLMVTGMLVMVVIMVGMAVAVVKESNNKNTVNGIVKVQSARQ